MKFGYQVAGAVLSSAALVLTGLAGPALANNGNGGNNGPQKNVGYSSAVNDPGNLPSVGAEAYAGRAIGSLSGGEQQRLLIAQALIRRPSLLLLDEPLDSLDLTNQAAVAALVQRICREEGVAVLLVAHDANPILGYLDRVVYFAGGTAVEGTPAEVITAETLSRLYGAPVEVLHTSDGRLVVVGLPEAPFHHGPRHAH